MASVINRYYDPSTDQFISIDPAVAQTGQPYLFTNDNPLNTSDPLGLGVKKKLKEIGVCVIFVCVNGGAQADTVIQPQAARGHAPTEQAERKKEGIPEVQRGPANTEQPIKPVPDPSPSEMSRINFVLTKYLGSSATIKYGFEAATAAGAAWLLGLALIVALG